MQRWQIRYTYCLTRKEGVVCEEYLSEQISRKTDTNDSKLSAPHSSVQESLFVNIGGSPENADLRNFENIFSVYRTCLFLQSMLPGREVCGDIFSKYRLSLWLWQNLRTKYAKIDSFLVPDLRLKYSNVNNFKMTGYQVHMLGETSVSIPPISIDTLISGGSSVIWSDSTEEASGSNKTGPCRMARTPRVRGSSDTQHPCSDWPVVEFMRLTELLTELLLRMLMLLLETTSLVRQVRLIFLHTEVERPIIFQTPGPSV